jgi:hypothetical protein
LRWIKQQNTSISRRIRSLAVLNDLRTQYRFSGQTKIPRARLMIEELLANTQQMIELLNQTFAAAEQENQQGIADFVAGRLSTRQVSMATAQLSERPASMSNDIRSILDRLATVEGKLSPAQQKVPQLPALFKPRHIRALGAKTDPAHPMDGYMVGDSVEPQRTALEEAMAEIEEDMISKVKKDLTHTWIDWKRKSA